MTSLVNERLFGMTCSRALWGGKIESIPQECQQNLFDEFRSHSLLAIPLDILKSMGLDKEIMSRWRKQVIITVARNVHVIETEKRIIQLFQKNDIAFAIIKGTAASQYYPKPEYRTLGDIDIIVKPEQYTLVCDLLLANGFRGSMGFADEARGRSFSNKDVQIDLHRYIARRKDQNTQNEFQTMILDNIDTEHHYLPDLVNGIVLLYHIEHHIESGIGFRQIIDWMMFVDRCLDDATWEVNFQPIAKHFGLDQLAKTTTRMCQLFLGLKQSIAWCQSTDEVRCQLLYEYIFDCGNFGYKHLSDHDKNASISLLSKKRNLFEWIRTLQYYGQHTWTLLKRFPFLRPFAWIYQACRFAHRAIKRKKPRQRIKEEYAIALQKQRLIQSLGIDRGNNRR